MFSKQLTEALAESGTDMDDWHAIDAIATKFTKVHNASAKAMAKAIAMKTGWATKADPGGWAALVKITTPVTGKDKADYSAMYASFGSQADYRQREITIVVKMEKPWFGPESKQPRDRVELWKRGADMLHARSGTFSKYGRVEAYVNDVAAGFHLSVPVDQADEMIAKLDKIAAEAGAIIGQALSSVELTGS